MVILMLSGIIVIDLFDDVEGPRIYEVNVSPQKPVVGDRISVTVYCVDPSGISSVSLSYSLNGQEWQVKDMTFYTCFCSAGGRWIANFGPLEQGDAVKFFITAYDDAPLINHAETQVFNIQVES